MGESSFQLSGFARTAGTLDHYTLQPHPQPYASNLAPAGKEVEPPRERFSRKEGHGMAGLNHSVKSVGLGRAFTSHSKLQEGASLLAKTSDQEQAETRLEYARVKQEHTDFDAAINAMMAVGCDPLQIQRMKKKKLALKDRIKMLEDRIVPDIIA